MTEASLLIPRVTSGLVGLAVAHAAVLVLVRTLRKGRSSAAVVLWLIEISALGLIVLRMPFIVHGPVAPLIMATAFGGVLVTQASHLATGRPNTRPTVTDRALALGGWGVLVIPAALSLLAWLVWVSPYCEGVDFYYYVLWARDRLAEDPAVVAARDLYLPGVYVFWGSVLRVAGGLDLRFLHVAVQAMVIAMATVTAAAAWRVGVGRLTALLGGFVTFALASRLEGFQGVTEPLVMAAFMTGVVIWAGAGLDDASGLWARVALALASAVAIWFKLQGVLLLAGFATLAVADIVSATSRRGQRRAVAAAVFMPALAILVAVALVLLDGRGLAPIRGALGWGRDYRIEGTLTQLIRPFWDEAGWVLLAATVAFLLLLVLPALRTANGNMFRVVAFCWGSGVATLYQFSRRAYLHYGLLTVAPAVVCAAVGVTLLARRVRLSTAPSGLATWCLVTTVALVVARGNADGSGAWVPLDVPHGLPPYPVMRHDPQVAHDLAELCEVMEPGDDLVVLPARRNFVHVVCGTVPRSRPLRYTWAIVPGEYRDTLSNPELRRVLVFSDLASYADQESCGPGGCPALINDIPSLGYEPTRSWPTFTLFSRAADPGGD